MREGPSDRDLLAAAARFAGPLAEAPLMSGVPAFLQLAYVVPDIREAALSHSRLFGSGPFFVAENIEFVSSTYRSAPVLFRHSAAFGQWGDVQIEFMQPEDDSRSVLTDVLDRSGGRPAVHHQGRLVADPVAEAARFAEAGYPIAWHGVRTSGVDVFMIDTLDLYGHMVELYAPLPAMIRFIDMIRVAANDFDGAEVLRDMVTGQAASAPSRRSTPLRLGPDGWAPIKQHN